MLKLNFKINLNTCRLIPLFTPLHVITENMQSILTIQSLSRDRSRSLAIARGEEWERTGGHVDYINSHTTSLSANLKLDPDS